MMCNIFIASNNAHKRDEIVSLSLYYGLKLKIHSASQIGGMPEVEESGATFRENALLKAMALVPSLPQCGAVISDDSGLVVDAINGEPGIRSARYAGESASAFDNNSKLLEAIKDTPYDRRTARFVCVICFIKEGKSPDFFEGQCEGHIALQKNPVIFLLL